MADLGRMHLVVGLFWIVDAGQLVSSLLIFHETCTCAPLSTFLNMLHTCMHSDLSTVEWLVLLADGCQAACYDQKEN